MARVVAIMFVGAAALVAAPQAGAAQVIGQASPGSGICGQYGGSTFIQSGSELSRYAAPFDGVITSWRNGGQWVNPTFKIARLGSGSTYTVIASDGPRSTVGEDIPVRFPIRQGDVIGVHIPSAVHSCAYPSSAGDVVGVDNEANLAPGGTGSFDYSTTFQVNVAATIERDRDNDGFGDESQDACPSSPFTQGTCPLPTTIGRVIAPAPDGGCGGYTYIPVAPRDYRYTVPADGIVTSWSYSAGATDAPGTVQLKAMRPQEGEQFVTIGQDAARDPAAGSNTFATRLAVRQGDRIALAVTGGLNCLSSSGSGLSLQHEGNPAVGSPVSFSERTRALSLAAVVEADRDGDGFGDTSQDRCPTDASTQGTCPVKPPPVDRACEKARAKLSKAKAKLAKLKRNDAAAKKVKKAKKAVKKAKGKVKKAC